jgi:hypothetical protein
MELITMQDCEELYEIKRINEDYQIERIKEDDILNLKILLEVNKDNSAEFLRAIGYNPEVLKK